MVFVHDNSSSSQIFPNGCKKIDILIFIFFCIGLQTYITEFSIYFFLGSTLMSSLISARRFASSI